MSKSENQLPFAFIPKEEVNARVTLYQANTHPLLSNAIGKQDTKSIWYTIGHFEQLMNELNLLEASGMRIYLATYPSDHVDYSNQTCLVMVPTRFNGQTMNHEDIIVEEEPGFEVRLRKFDPEAIRTMYKSFNFGSPCPAACYNQDPEYPY